MKRETQDKWINIGSGILTVIVIASVSYFSISSYQKIQQSALNDDAVKISDENKIAKSERIDTQEVENELNRIAEAQRLEQERLAAEKAAREKAERERMEAEKRAVEKAAQEKLAQEKAERERIAAEKQAAEKREAERIATEKAAAEKRAQEKLAQEKAEQARIATEKQQAQEKAAQEKSDAERKAAEQKAAEQKVAEEKLAAEKAEKERLEKERLEKERLAAEKRAADQKAQEAKEAEEAARIASALSSEYFSQVHAFLYALWITPSGSYGLNTTIQFKVKEDGTIIGTPVITKESGNEEFDNSVFVAIMSAEKVPMPSDPVVRKYLAKEGFEIRFRPTN